MKKIVILIGAATLIAVNACVASACMCSTIGTPKTNLEKVEAVFLGKIVAAKRHEWTITVDKVWKGDVEERVMMRDPSAGSSCEAQFKLGESYVFFAYMKTSKQRSIYHPSACTWTTSLTFRHDGMLVSEYVLGELGDGQAPKKIPKDNR